MSSWSRELALLAASLVALVILPAIAFAADDEDDAEALLDQAMEARKSIKSLADLGEIIDLCQKSIDAGLKSPELARELMSSVLQQRALIYTQHLMTLADGAGADPNLAQQYPKILEAARNDVDRAIENDPEQIDSYMLLGRRTALPGGDKKDGIAALDKAAEMTEDRPTLLAKVLVARAGLREDGDDRLEDLNSALKADATNVDGLRARATILIAQDKLDEGLADLDGALAETTKMAHARVARAGVGATEEVRRSDRALDKAVDLQPRSAIAYAQRGRVRLAKEDAKEAIHDFDKALLLSPDNPQILLLRAGHINSTARTRRPWPTSKRSSRSPDSAQAQAPGGYSRQARAIFKTPSAT